MKTYISDAGRRVDTDADTNTKFRYKYKYTNAQMKTYIGDARGWVAKNNNGRAVVVVHKAPQIAEKYIFLFV